MSYGAAAALQAGIFALLSADDRLAGAAIVDALPAGGGSGTFILIGPEEALDASDKSGGGAEHRFIVSVISDAAGFLEAKTAAAVVSDSLVDAKPTLSRGRVVGIRFMKAVAKRLDDGGVRRIDLTFRARIEV
jgi:hypothetical protein